MFNYAQNTTIYGGTFIANGTQVSLLDALNKQVSPNAILNAGGRADEVRCHPGTREEVIGRIKKWKTNAQNGVTSDRIFWLSGPAGAGKTAIVQTVAESWRSDDVHTANYFFFRTDTSRNHALSLVATLLYQIFSFYPTTCEAVEKVLASQPRILDASIKEQFNHLICSPLRSIGPLLSQPIVLIIDGLDECDTGEKTAQQQILLALDMLVSQSDLPFLVLVASRVSHQITMAFKQLSSEFDSIFLDDQYLPHKDIHLFVTAEFDKVKTTHGLAYMLEEDWPSASDVDGIVTKSSGQFIYAATAMRFILHSSASPNLSLEKVQGAARIATSSPFSQLDAIYTYIFSRADDQEALRDILHAHFVMQTFYQDHSHDCTCFPTSAPTLQHILQSYNPRYTKSVLDSCIADLAAIAQNGNQMLKFYHASLSDFLRDQSRSGEYFVDLDAFSVKMRAARPSVEAVVRDLIKAELKSATIDQLIGSLQNPSDFGGSVSILSMNETFKIAYGLCTCDDDVANYKQMIRKWIIHYMSIDLSDLEKKELHDIPCSQRYIAMVEIERLHGDIKHNPNILVNNLRPESAFDARETTVWIENLLKLIHGQFYPHHLETYKRLVGQWISWAILNRIALGDLDQIPYSRRYILQGTVGKWVARVKPDGRM